jgi:hypothetical protein
VALDVMAALSWDTHQIGIRGSTADRENRRVPFDSHGRLAAIPKRRESLGPPAYAFGTPSGEYQANIQTAWKTVKLFAHGFELKRGADGECWNRERLRDIEGSNFRCLLRNRRNSPQHKRS